MARLVALIPAISSRTANLRGMLLVLGAQTRPPDHILLCLDGPGWRGAAPFVAGAVPIVVHDHEGETRGAGARWLHPGLDELGDDDIVWCLDDDVKLEPSSAETTWRAAQMHGTVSWHGQTCDRLTSITIDDAPEHPEHIHYAALAGLALRANLARALRVRPFAATILGRPGGYDQVALAVHLWLAQVRITRPAGAAPVKFLQLDEGSFGAHAMRWMGQRDALADRYGWAARVPAFEGRIALLTEAEREEYLAAYSELARDLGLHVTPNRTHLEDHRPHGTALFAVPTLRRHDEARALIITAEHDRCVDADGLLIDNGPINRGVAAAWNTALRVAVLRGYGVLVIANDDVTMSADTLRVLLGALDREPGAIVAQSQIHAYAFFAIRPREALAQVGFFDDGFWPAYAEDTDWNYRARIAGAKIAVVRHSELGFEHIAGASSAHDEAWRQQIIAAGIARFIEKWGGEPGLETRTSPRSAHIDRQLNHSQRRRAAALEKREIQRRHTEERRAISRAQSRQKSPAPLVPEAALEKIAERVGLKLNLGCCDRVMPGYENVDIIDGPGVDSVVDLSQGPWPWPSGAVTHIVAHDVIEHLPNKIQTMNEIHRVLEHDGTVDILVPTTDGRGAWQDPTHVSFWNRNSFWYYEKGNAHHDRFAHHYGITASFRVTAERVIRNEAHDVSILHIVLAAVKR